MFTDVQQGEAQTQRGSRKGKKWIAGTVCCVLHACLWRPILHMESCSASLAAKLQNPFMLNSPYIHFPIWVVFPSETAISLTHIHIVSVIYVKTHCTLDKIMVGWGFIPTVIALYGSVPDTSFCLPHCSIGGECEKPKGVESGLKQLCCGL